MGKKKSNKLPNVQKNIRKPSAVVPFSKERKWISYEEVYYTGVAAGETRALADANVDRYTDLLTLVIVRVHDPFIFSQTLPEKWQPSQLRAYYMAIGEHEGIRIDDQLSDLSVLLVGVIETAKSYYQSVNNVREDDPLYLGEMIVLQWANALKDGLQKLLDEEDEGETLFAAIQKYQGDVMEARAKAMRDSALAFAVHGKDPGVTWIANEVRALAVKLEIDPNTRENQKLLGHELYKRLSNEQSSISANDLGKSKAWSKLNGCIRKGQVDPDEDQLRDVVHNALRLRPIG